MQLTTNYKLKKPDGTDNVDINDFNYNADILDNALATHKHTKSQITDMPSALKNPNALTIQLNGSSQGEYDGSSAKTINVTKSSIGLSNVDNTSDANKPISTATQNALNGKANSNHTHDDRYYTENEIDNKLGGKVPTSSNSSITVQADADSSSTSEYISLRAGGNELKIISSAGGSSPAKTNNVFYNGNALYHTGHKPSKGDVGLGNVDNTSDLNKPISTAMQNALNGKANSSHTHNYAGSSSAGGAANSAVKLATARTIALTGNVTGSANFDGSGNITINTSGISAIPTNTVSALFN